MPASKPLPRSLSPHVNFHDLSEPTVYVRNRINAQPQSLIREITASKPVSAQAITSLPIVSQVKRNQPRRPTFSPMPNASAASPNKTRPAPKGLDMKVMSKTDLLKSQIRSRSPTLFQSKLDLGLGLTSPTSSNILQSTEHLLASAKKVSLKPRVDSKIDQVASGTAPNVLPSRRSVSPQMQHRHGLHERRRPRALNMTEDSDASNDSILQQLNASRDIDNITLGLQNESKVNTQNENDAASKLLETLQHSLDRPVFSPYVKSAGLTGSSKPLPGTQTIVTDGKSSPLSPMRMKLDSVARDAKDILARVRTFDSPSFSYLKNGATAATESSKLDSSALQDRAKELSLRIKAMREGRK